MKSISLLYLSLLTLTATVEASCFQLDLVQDEGKSDCKRQACEPTTEYIRASELLPFIVELFQVKPRQTTLEDFSTEQWIERLRHGPVETLTKSGPAAASILAAAMRDPEAAVWVWHTMGQDQRQADWTIPVYVAGLHNSEHAVRMTAVQQLTAFGPRVSVAVPGIAQEIRTFLQYGDNQAEIAKLISATSPSKKEALELLCVLYDRPTVPGVGNSFDRQAILESMIQLGPVSAPRLVDAVINATGDQTTWLFLVPLPTDFHMPLAEELRAAAPSRRRSAAWLISRQVQSTRMPVFSAEFLQRLLTHLDDEDGFVREYLLDFFLEAVPVGDEAARRLAAQFNDQHDQNLYRAAQCLGRMGEDAISVIRESAAGDDPRSRLGAAVALRSLAPSAAAEASLLIRLAGDGDLNVRLHAIDGLGTIPSPDKNIVDTLVMALNDEQTFSSAAWALGQSEGMAVDALPSLLKMLRTATPEQKITLLEAIRRIDPSSDVVVAGLRDLMKITTVRSIGYSVHTEMADGKRIESRRPMHESVAASAAAALGRLGADAAPVAGDLLEAAHSDDETLAGNAIRALGQIGPPARQAVPFLSTLASADGKLSAVSIESLARINQEPGSDTATPSAAAVVP